MIIMMLAMISTLLYSLIIFWQSRIYKGFCMKCKEERFLRDVKGHSMKVVKDDGAHRHLSFTNNGSSVYRFDLITWPGFLCIAGDCGTYVFSRTTDMFCFFRTDKNDFNYNKEGMSINPGYWAEKMQTEKSHHQGEVFNEELILKSILEHATQQCDDLDFLDYRDSQSEMFDSQDDFKNAHIEEIKEHFKYKEMDEHRFCDAVDDFSSEISDDLNFVDEWEWIETHEYSFRYLWCLYAIVYGISIYDELNGDK